MQELPLYTCHKKVRAAKITDYWISVDGNLMLELGTIGTVEAVHRGITDVSKADLIGGYLVVYEDGYQSWSPAKAFEEGYTKD